VVEDQKGRVGPDRRETRLRIHDFLWVPAIVGLFIVGGVASIISRAPAASWTVSTRFRTVTSPMRYFS
jgi:hypothetical protein